MHQLGVALSRSGHFITGSDDEIFEPSRTVLEKEGILPAQNGWFPEKIHTGLDLVILGMHARADNPELLQAEALGIRVLSFPEFIFEQSKDKTRIVVAGSHGKTTITSMIMHCLQMAGKEFDYLVGAKLAGFDQMVKISDAPIMVLEGDEYLASARQPYPKIHFYKPHITVISGLSWDHINVFPTRQIYIRQFEIYLENLDSRATVIYNNADPEVADFMQKFLHTKNCIPYGLPAYRISAGHYHILDKEDEYELSIIGSHNLNNLEAARIVCEQIGLSTAGILQSLTSFTGAARRLERILDMDDRVVFWDFAHAPSKVKASLAAVKELFPQRRITAILELHTFSSLHKQFIPEYAQCLESADEAVVFYSPHAIQLKRLQKPDQEFVRQCFQDDRIIVIEEREQLKDWLKNHNWADSALLFMSSGNFDGLDLQDITTFMAEKEK